MICLGHLRCETFHSIFIPACSPVRLPVRSDLRLLDQARIYKKWFYFATYPKKDMKGWVMYPVGEFSKIYVFCDILYKAILHFQVSKERIYSHWDDENLNKFSLKTNKEDHSLYIFLKSTHQHPYTEGLTKLNVKSRVWPRNNSGNNHSDWERKKEIRGWFVLFFSMLNLND